ncbi:phosphatidate cytidylyltransferase, putative [Plasmodium gallinaceum]|uniref:dolichol kinase n=1 Tax=Plasmodium gallinaceum TaxID=5849 RepID=A0A1J1GLP7_PLAGA|nr:phosphatidate cytidylyltransferase, putative [Plasmodium gallinaceum]CRG93352.1 phosphatidate cytidylyltransferase, putative [Plasmodium gallinaceum]
MILNIILLNKMLNKVYQFFMKDLGMINILLVSLIIITELKKKVFIFCYFTYIWIFQTLLCNILISTCLYYNRKNKKESKLKDNINSFLDIGSFYKYEKLTNLSKKNNHNFINLYEKDEISIFQLFYCIYLNNIFPSLFLPFFSTLLILKYRILTHEVAILSILYVNKFVLSSIYLRYVKINILTYIAYNLSFFFVIINLIKINEKLLIIFLFFFLNFTFYHLLLIGCFYLTNKVFTFLEGLLISVIGTLILDCSFYCHLYIYLNNQIIPNTLFIFFSKIIISLVIYGMCCIYCLQKEIKKKKLFLSSVLFFLYNILNLFSNKYDSTYKKNIKVFHIIINIIRRKNNYLLISLWFIITILYLIYIYNIAKKNKNLPYIRKHYHFLLLINVYLSFITNKVELLILTLSFVFLLFILIEIIRKIYESLFPFSNIIKKIITRFIDERDKKGLVLTHIYLLSGVYIPIIIDAIFNDKNYIHKKNQITYDFRETNLTLYSIGLNTLCIGDSFAAIGGLIYPKPKIKNTNNKSYAGLLFFFFSTFFSLIIFEYFFERKCLNLNIFFIVSLFGAIFEAYLYDIDNLLLPLFTFCVYLSFEN